MDIRGHRLVVRGTYLQIGKLINALDPRKSMDANPGENVDVCDAIFTASGTCKPVAVSKADFKHAVQTFRLIEVSCIM